MAGRLITVEGGEGAGKTTQLAFMRDYLTQAGLSVVMTREPGGAPLSEDIRHLLLSHRHDGMTLAAETLLMFAARAEHLEKVIRPALAAGSWVLCDRFTENGSRCWKTGCRASCVPTGPCCLIFLLRSVWHGPESAAQRIALNAKIRNFLNGCGSLIWNGPLSIRIVTGLWMLTALWTSSRGMWQDC